MSYMITIQLSYCAFNRQEKYENEVNILQFKLIWITF